MSTPIADLVRTLGAAGCSIEQIALAVENQEQQIVAREKHRSDKNAARQRRWRESHNSTKRNVTSHDVTSVTQGNPENDASLSLPSLTDSQKKKEGVGGRARGARLPDDWAPSPLNIEFATKHRCSAAETDTEGIKFRNYWTAKTGPAATKRNWDRTWENWILNRRAGHVNGTGKRTVVEAADDLLAKLKSFDEPPPGAGGVRR